MQMWRSTRTMPSARLNDAPVGQTSTQGALAQCWHIIGSDRAVPLLGSLKSILRIHCASVSRVVCGRRFSRMHAVTQSVQPAAQRVVSISRPQRTLGDAGSVGAFAVATS